MVWTIAKDLPSLQWWFCDEWVSRFRVKQFVQYWINTNEHERNSQLILLYLLISNLVYKNSMNMSGFLILLLSLLSLFLIIQTCFASPEIIWVEFGNRETDRQTDKFFDTIYGGMLIFLSVKFATSLLASLAGG